MNFIYHKNNDVAIKGANRFSASEAEQWAYEDKISPVIEECDIDAEVLCVYAHGSRLFGNPKENSDLDFVVFYTGSEREDDFFNALTDEPYSQYGIACDFNPILVDEETAEEDIEDYIRVHDIEYHKSIHENRVVRVSKSLKLFEDTGLAAGIGAGNAAGTYNNYGFSYEIKPLVNNLSQKGNDPGPENRNNCFKHFVGDVVKGYCPYDNKKHKGMIKYMYYQNSEDTMPKLVYILDFENEIIVPLEANTLKSFKTVTLDSLRLFMNPYNTDPWQARAADIDHDFAAVSPILERYKYRNQK